MTKRKTHRRVGSDFEDFLRDDSDPSVTLATISRAALALDKQVRLKLAA